MKISLAWLKDYVAFDGSAQQLAERLTLLGIEVEAIQKIGDDFPQIVVAQILASQKHPNADRLSVCRVADGSGERQIVCGAKNYKPGDKVPLALPGAALPNGVRIKVGKIRGVESHGMMCSAAELKLAEDAEGLLILPPDTPVGAPLADALGGSDAVLDLEITPNRPDLLSHIGIAREIACATDSPLKWPSFSLFESGEHVKDFATIVVESPDLCPRYTARLIRDVKIGPSPPWLRQRLERVGARSINNVVDITNFVLYEIGQPLHAFDFGQLNGRTLVVRRARAGETMITLDNEELKLDPNHLVIADTAQPACLAGIIGGQNSGVSTTTRDILLESACFHPRCVRAASRTLGVRSESSYRFERGADIGVCDWASRRAAALIAELAGGKICSGVIDTNPNPKSPRPIPCRYSRINSRLGIEVPPDAMKKIFKGLSLRVTHESADACDVQPPSFRVDLANEADLSEEVGRIYGIEKIPSEIAPARPTWSDADIRYDAVAKLRALLVSMGYWEVLTPILVPRTKEITLRLKNPLSEEMAALRGDLLRSLLNCLRDNVRRGNTDLRLFEIGRVFSSEGEKNHLALALTGARAPAHWSGNGPKADFYDLKAALETLGVPDTPITQLSPQLARQYDLRDPVFLAELDLDNLLASRLPSSAPVYQELPRFPSIARDIALVLAEEITHAQIVAAIREAKPDWLQDIIVFDIFRGGAISSGKKSVAYRITYRSADRTLTDAEVNRVHEKVKAAVKKSLRCEVRE